jgi:hypothetical protein
MTTEKATKKKPLWLLIEEEFLALDPQAISGGTPEETIQRIAGNLDGKGYNVSKHGGHMVQLRFAAEDMRKVGRPLMKDFTDAIGAFTLDDVMDAYAASDKLITDVGAAWPKLKQAECRPVVIGFVEQRKLDLLIEKAKSLPGDDGIELLINESVAFEVIASAMEITPEKLKEVNTAMEKRRAERERVLGLLEKVADKSDEDKVRFLFDNNVAEPLILQLAGVDQSAIDGAKKAMEAELAEKKRLEEEAAAKKAAEAAGPALDDISPEDMLDHIEAIREIMEFSEEEKEIRVMCEQSAIPKALVDIAVSEPAKLDELEKQAGG